MNLRTRTEVLLLVAFCGFLFFYGRGSFGLVGADEPRYAQVAREMLDRHDWITPTLMGKPWLEKPALYYWEAFVWYSVFGVSDSAARLPGAVDAALMIAVIYFFLRRLRRGSEEDGALITAGSAAIIGFAHAAATDMPLAATFTIALLGWHAWFECRKRLYLAAFYIFLALATLAKGPVSPVLAGMIVVIFAAVMRDWRIFRRTLWIPGILLFLVVALPWYIAVQLRNPEFFRVFILQHNLARFSENLYHHRQPFWYYVPVLLLSLMPWTLWLILALVERVPLLWTAAGESENQDSYRGMPSGMAIAEHSNRTSRRWLFDRNALSNPDDAWQLFLLLWLFVPVAFFSVSQSKLPGYILPAMPAGALLVTEYIAARRSDNAKIALPLAAIHGVLCGLLVLAALTTASFQRNHRLVAGKGTYVAVAISAVIALGIAAALLTRNGLRLLRSVTLIAVVVGVAAILRLAAPAIDEAQSARPIAESILSFSHEPVPLALYHVNRAQEYGLEFYLNRPAQHYDTGEVPAEAHVLVAAQNARSQLGERLRGRKVSYLTNIPAQKLDVYWVGK